VRNERKKNSESSNNKIQNQIKQQHNSKRKFKEEKKDSIVYLSQANYFKNDL